MLALESSNPVLRSDRLPRTEFGSTTMTMNGAVNKSLMLGAILVLSSLVVGQVASPESYQIWLIGGAISGFGLAMMTTFKPEWAATSAPLYAICEGASLSVLTMLANTRYPGIAMNAFLLTTGTLLAMLMAWKTGLIQVTEKLRSGLVMATGAICLMYLVTFIANLFGANLGFLHDSSPLSIGISLVVIVVASLSLLLDFEMIEQVSMRRAPEYMEWYAGFALMVTLIWLYVEFLNLLMKLQKRD